MYDQTLRSVVCALFATWGCAAGLRVSVTDGGLLGAPGLRCFCWCLAAGQCVLTQWEGYFGHLKVCCACFSEPMCTALLLAGVTTRPCGSAPQSDSQSTGLSLSLVMGGVETAARGFGTKVAMDPDIKTFPWWVHDTCFPTLSQVVGQTLDGIASVRVLI